MWDGNFRPRSCFASMSNSHRFTRLRSKLPEPSECRARTLRLTPAHAVLSLFRQEALQKARIRQVPQWMELDDDKPKGKVVALPTREQIDTQVNEQLIVEFYSK